MMRWGEQSTQQILDGKCFCTNCAFNETAHNIVPHTHKKGKYNHQYVFHLFYGSNCDHKEERQATGDWGSWGVYH